MAAENGHPQGSTAKFEAKRACAARGVSTGFLDDTLLIFDAKAKAIFALNPTAAFVWICMDDQLSLPQTIREFAKFFQVPDAIAEASVEETVSLFLARGWLEHGESTAPVSVQSNLQDPSANQSESRVPVLSGDAFEFGFELAGSTILVRAQSQADLEAARQVCLPLEPNVDSYDGLFEILDGEDGKRIIVDGAVAYNGLSPNQVSHAVIYQAKSFARSRVRLLMAIHAAAVTDGAGLVLIAGPSGAGKTTLTAALLRHGYSYLTEDTTLVDRETCRIIPVQACLCVKEGAWKVVSEIYPGLNQLPIHARLEGTLVRYLPPPAGGIAYPADQDLPVRALVFTKYRDDEPTSLKPISRIEALPKLDEAGYEIGDGFGPAEFDDFLKWFGGITTYELTVSTLPEAVEYIGQALRQ